MTVSVQRGWLGVALAGALRKGLYSRKWSFHAISPMGEACGPSGNANGLTLSYSLNKLAARVVLRVYSVQTGQVMLENQWVSVSAGTHTVFLPGTDDAGRYLDEGLYRVGLCASDDTGHESLWKYNLIRTIFAYQKSGGQP